MSDEPGYYLGRSMAGVKCLVVRKVGSPAEGFYLGPSKAGMTFDPTGKALRSQYRISAATFVVLVALLDRVRKQKGL